MATHDDELFRSQFMHANHLDDRSYGQARPAYELGREAGADPSNRNRDFETIEKDLENGWLNVRAGSSDWSSVREFARVGFNAAQQGRIEDAPPAGDADRAPYSDPLPPDSPL